MTKAEPRQWWICGSLAEEDVSQPFEGATKVIEYSAYEELKKQADLLAEALGNEVYEKTELASEILANYETWKSK